MDLDNEIAKCDKKLDLVRLNLQKVVKLESQAEYEETVPLNVRAANEEKVMFFFLACSDHSDTFPFLEENIGGRIGNFGNFEKYVCET